MDPHSRLLAEILRIPGFSDAIKAMLETEIAGRTTILRAAVREGQQAEAAVTEGVIQGLESVPALLAQFTKSVVPIKE